MKTVATMAALWAFAFTGLAAAQTGEPAAEAFEAAAAAIVPTPAPAASPQNRRLTAKERWRIYWREIFWSPGALLGPATAAASWQLTNEPEAWGQGTAGYSRRFASGFGRSAIESTFQATGAALLGHEVRYIRSMESGFISRVLHALTANFVTTDSHGGHAPNYSRVGAVFGADLVRSRWMPDGYNGIPRALGRGAIEFSAGGAFQILQEFSPDLKRIFQRKRTGPVPSASPHASQNDTPLNRATPGCTGTQHETRR